MFISSSHWTISVQKFMAHTYYSTSLESFTMCLVDFGRSYITDVILSSICNLRKIFIYLFMN